MRSPSAVCSWPSALKRRDRRGLGAAADCGISGSHPAPAAAVPPSDRGQQHADSSSGPCTDYTMAARSYGPWRYRQCRYFGRLFRLSALDFFKLRDGMTCAYAPGTRVQVVYMENDDGVKRLLRRPHLRARGRAAREVLPRGLAGPEAAAAVRLIAVSWSRRSPSAPIVSASATSRPWHRHRRPLLAKGAS